MRILIHEINFHPEMTGTGKYTGEMANWLATRGHAVRVVTTPPHYPEWRVARPFSAWKYTRDHVISDPDLEQRDARPMTGAGMLEIFRCPVWVPRAPQGIRRLFYLTSFALSSWPVMLRQMRWRPDLVLLVEPTLFCVIHALLVARCSRSRAWLHVQDFEVDAAFELGDLSSSWLRKVALACERRILQQFDRVSTISDRMVEALLSKGMNASRCVVFPNWVDTAVIRPMSNRSLIRQELAIPDETIVALYSGSMGKKHGLDLLLDAARELRNRRDIHFVFSGDGPYRPILDREAASLPNVSLLPLQPTERLNELLNLADIHLLPQKPDAADLVMPSKLTGMLASGRPVIATAAIGTQIERVVGGRGLVIPPSNLEHLVSAIVRLADNASLRIHLGKQARRYALMHLDANVILQTFESNIVSLCQG